jgi:S1-C subfamily serine protease
MKQVALTILICVLLTAAGCATGKKNPVDRLGPESAVVRISSTKANQPAVEGRGFLVTSDGIIATCAKFVADGQLIEVTMNDGRSYSGKFLEQDKDSGVALIQIKGTELPALSLFDGDIIPGMHVRAFGSAGVTHGRFDHWENFGRDIDFTARVQPQDWGAPILADDGRAMGVIIGPIEGESAEFDAAPIWQVLRLMPQLARPHPYTD